MNSNSGWDNVALTTETPAIGSNPSSSGWWLASDGQWYPPETAPGASGPDGVGPEKKKKKALLSSRWAWLGVGLAGLFVLLVLIGIAAGPTDKDDEAVTAKPSETTTSTTSTTIDPKVAAATALCTDLTAQLVGADQAAPVVDAWIGNQWQMQTVTTEHCPAVAEQLRGLEQGRAATVAAAAAAQAEAERVAAEAAAAAAAAQAEAERQAAAAAAAAQAEAERQAAAAAASARAEAERQAAAAAAAERETESPSSGGGGAAYYPNCAAAKAAGAAPLFRGDPGYSGKLDRDGDGVACE